MKNDEIILIVEDEAITAMLVKKELMSAGYQKCVTSATGEDAVRISSEQAVALILMDINLAGEIDGIEAASQIKAARNIPLIFLSGYSDKEVLKRAEEVHPQNYLVKPVPMPTLLKSVEKALNSGQ